MDPPQVLSKFFSAQYLPSTFEERGTTAPFTTPVLSGARVRLDERHNLVLLTPGFSGTQSVYVLPWRAIPEMVTMTVHDRALHDAVEEASATTPSAMRREVLRIAATGLAGPDTQAAARKAIEDDRNYGNEIHAVLIMFLMNALGIDISRMTGLDFGRSDIMNQAKQALKAATTPLGVEPDVLYERMGKLSAALSFIGLASFGNPGRLRNLLRQLGDFQRDMDHRSNRVNTDAAAFFGFTAEVATHTISLAGSILKALDHSLEDLPAIVRGWDMNFPKLLHRASRLSWLLDGWDYSLSFASKVDEWSGDELWVNLDTLSRMLPMLPKAEKDDEEARTAKYAEVIQRRRVFAMQDWRTGIIDNELTRRLEDAKARAI